ncbi:MAG: hypothetical protein JXA42_15375, partial [Anaerolineales bacterium]|nr:hypothetical protein [Anaerolineales bacterium]
MNPKRPDLQRLDPDVRAYIEALEAELAKFHKEPESEPDEPVFTEEPTTINIISISASGVAKRTPRHFYSQQRRGGMGVFDLITPENEPPTFVAAADQSESIFLITNEGRAFRVPVEEIVETAVNSRGQSIVERFSFLPKEHIRVVLPQQSSTYAAVLSERGYVRWLVGHLLSERLKPGTVLYDVEKHGRPAAACWATANCDLFVGTRKGLGVRFPSRQLPLTSCALGIRLEPGDQALSISAVDNDTNILMVTDDGKGTIRSMSSFRANKSLGVGGKITVKTDAMIGSLNVTDRDHVFILSRLGKMIRFRADEIPAKT